MRTVKYLTTKLFYGLFYIEICACSTNEDSDIYGAQQHGPLMDVELPI